MNNRDLKIAKRLQNAISQFFHAHDEIEACIEKVEMVDRRNAHVYYTVINQAQTSSIERIEEAHNNITRFLPQIKKHIAVELNLKGIPNLHFCIFINNND